MVRQAVGLVDCWIAAVVVPLEVSLEIAAAPGHRVAVPCQSRDSR